MLPGRLSNGRHSLVCSRQQGSPLLMATAMHDILIVEHCHRWDIAAIP